jgi:trigger factor
MPVDPDNVPLRRENDPSRVGPDAQKYQQGNPAWQSNSKVGSRSRVEKNKASLLAQKERQVSEKLHQEILEKIVKENSFDVPAALIESQEKHVQEDLGKNLKAQGFNDAMLVEYFSKWHADIHAKAEFQVRSGLVLDHLANELKIETSESDFDKKLSESAKMAGLDIDTVKKYYASNAQVKSNMMYAIREEKTFEELKKKIKVS